MSIFSRVSLGLLLGSSLACNQGEIKGDPNPQPPAPDAARPMVDTRTRVPGELLGSQRGGTLSGVVTLPAGVAPPDGAVLFVFARTPGVEAGPPVAVTRPDTKRWPVSFELGPESVMIPGTPFTGPFTVVARLDADGNAMTRGPGDWEGRSGAPVKPGERVEIALGTPGATPAAGEPVAAVPVAPPVEAAPAGESTANKAAAGGAITGQIRLAEGAQAPAGGVIFVMAKRPGGAGGPPLAVLRLPATTFPVAFELGQGQMMMPGTSLDGPVEVSARLDSDGDASSRSPTDLVGAAAGTPAMGASGVEIVLGPASR